MTAPRTPWTRRVLQALLGAVGGGAGGGEAARRADDALREAEARFRLLAQAMPQIVCVLGPAGEVEYVNEGWVEFSGMDLTASRAAGWERVLHPEDVQASRDTLRAVLSSRAARDVELRYRSRSGEFRWFLSRLAPIVEGTRVIRLVGSAVDIEDRKRAERELRQVNERLREADRRKDEFLGMLSHELRNPLAPIRNSIFVLDRADPGGPEARRAREVVRRQVGHLTRLVDDLLDLTRIARGKIELRRAPLDVAALARRSADDHRALLLDRGLALDVDVPEGEVLVSGDETRLSQVLGNLLSNAAKFTPAGGRVALSAAIEGQSAVVSIRDTGPGVDPAMLHEIFEPFTQAKQTLARSEGGLGLGLALVKGLVDLHGGEVRAVSGGEAGAEFVVTLPLLDPRERAGDAANAPAVPAAGARRRVLVVDDNRDAADSLAQLVRLLGHDPAVAYDGHEAITRARADPPDVILCDLGLPGLDGYEVARRVRAVAARPVRLVAVSGYAQPDDVARALEAGFDAHVAKPADPGRLEQLLR